MFVQKILLFTFINKSTYIFVVHNVLEVEKQDCEDRGHCPQSRDAAPLRGERPRSILVLWGNAHGPAVAIVPLTRKKVRRGRVRRGSSHRQRLTPSLARGADSPGGNVLFAV